MVLFNLPSFTPQAYSYPLVGGHRKFRFIHHETLKSSPRRKTSLETAQRDKATLRKYTSSRWIPPRSDTQMRSFGYLTLPRFRSLKSVFTGLWLLISFHFLSCSTKQAFGPSSNRSQTSNLLRAIISTRQQVSSRFILHDFFGLLDVWWRRCQKSLPPYLGRLKTL